MSIRRDDHRATMAFLGRLERDGVKALHAPAFSAYGGQGSGTGGWGGVPYAPWLPGAKFDYQAEAGDLWRNSAVAICLAWIADNFVEPALVVKRRIAGEPDPANWEPIQGHPLVRLLENPNPYQGWHAIAKGLCLSFRTDGNGYWMMAQGAAGDPLQLWWIPHHKIRPRWDSSGNEYIGWYEYRVDGRAIRLEVDQVIHFRDGIDPDNDRLGCAALKSNLREVSTDNQGSSFTATIMRNMGVIGYALSPAAEGDSFGDKEERDEIADTFQERFSGEGRGKPLVASRGMKIDRVGMTPEELALDKIMKIPESRICAALRVPAMVVGLAVGAEQRTFNNYAEARKAAYEDGLIPLQKEIARTINRVLMPLLGDPENEHFMFDYSRVECLSESADSRSVRFGEEYAKNRVRTLNEARQPLGLPPVAGGDRFSDGSSPEEGPQAPPPPVAAIAPGGVPPAEVEGDATDAEETKALRARTAEVLDRAMKALESRP